MGAAFGKYTLLEKIGSGGMAEIWRASLSGVDGFEKILVVKKILPQFARNRQFITMFVQEAKLTSLLHHANIVQLYELGEQDGEYYIAMEYVNGPDLLKILTLAARSKVRIPQEIALHLVTEVCKGLGYAHAATDIYGNPLHMVHLDVSPSNILTTWDGEVKLTDFGVAKASTGDSASPSDDRLKGKLGYMSPEQVTAKRIDHRSDLFSIGIILYEIFTLKRLFLGRTDIETLSNVRHADIDARLERHPDVPKGVQEIIRRALLRNPDSRFQSAYEVEEAISHYLFEERLRVTPHQLSRFLDGLFGRERTAPVDLSALREVSVPEPRLSDTVVSERRSRKATPLEPAVPLLESARFAFKSGHGGIFGPVDAANLKRLVGARAVSLGELVSIDGDPWLPLRDVPGIDTVLPRELLADDEPALESGEFSQIMAYRLIGDLVARQRSARLRVRSAGVIKEVWWRKGRVVQVTSSLKEELFGARLVAARTITPAQLAEALAIATARGRELGEVLVEQGALDPTRLSEALERQIRDKFVSLFAIAGGTYEYLAGHEAADVALPPFDPCPALAEAARRHLSSAFLESYAEQSASRSIRLASEPPFDAARFKLAPREHRVLTVVSSRPLQVSAFLRDHGKTPDARQAALMVLFLLHQTGFVRLT